MKSFILELENAFKEQQNSAKAKAMSAYMKNKFPFWGLPMPLRRDLQKPFVDYFKTCKREEQLQIIESLWSKQEREFHYVALDLLDTWKLNSYQKDDIDLFEKLICTHTWWDSVDTIASKFVGKYFKRFPDEIDARISTWIQQDNFWLHRTAILFQLSYRQDTNFDLLDKLIYTFKNNKEFFIQKAIGWSLRQYARVNPDEVVHCVEKQELTGLAKREALRKIDN